MLVLFLKEYIYRYKSFLWCRHKEHRFCDCRIFNGIVCFLTNTMSDCFNLCTKWGGYSVVILRIYGKMIKYEKRVYNVRGVRRLTLISILGGIIYGKQMGLFI